MKSVGESLAIGRTFTEAMNKALRSGGDRYWTELEPLRVREEKLERMLTTLHPQKIFAT